MYKTCYIFEKGREFVLGLVSNRGVDEEGEGFVGREGERGILGDFEK